MCDDIWILKMPQFKLRYSILKRFKFTKLIILN